MPNRSSSSIDIARAKWGSSSRASRVRTNGNLSIMLRFPGIFLWYLLLSTVACADPIHIQRVELPKLKRRHASERRIGTHTEPDPLPLRPHFKNFESHLNSLQTFRDKRLAANDANPDASLYASSFPQTVKAASIRKAARSFSRDRVQGAGQEALDHYNAAAGTHIDRVTGHQEVESAEGVDMDQGDLISMSERVDSPKLRRRGNFSTSNNFAPTRISTMLHGARQPLKVTSEIHPSPKLSSRIGFRASAIPADRSLHKNQTRNGTNMAFMPLVSYPKGNQVYERTEDFSRPPTFQAESLHSGSQRIFPSQSPMRKLSFLNSSTGGSVKNPSSALPNLSNTKQSKAHSFSVTNHPKASGRNRELETGMVQSNSGRLSDNARPWHENTSLDIHLGQTIPSRSKDNNLKLKALLLRALQSKLGHQGRAVTETGRAKAEGHVTQSLQISGSSEARVSQHNTGQVGDFADLNSGPEPLANSPAAPDSSKTKAAFLRLPVARYRYKESAASLDHSAGVTLASRIKESGFPQESRAITETSHDYPWANQQAFNHIPPANIETESERGHEIAELEQTEGKYVEPMQGSSHLFANPQVNSYSQLNPAGSRDDPQQVHKPSLDDLLVMKMKEYLIQLAKNDSTIKLNLDDEFFNQQTFQNDVGSPAAHGRRDNGKNSSTLSSAGSRMRKKVPLVSSKPSTKLRSGAKINSSAPVGQLTHGVAPIVGHIQGSTIPLYENQQGYKSVVENGEPSRHANHEENALTADSSGMGTDMEAPGLANLFDAESNLGSTNKQQRFMEKTAAGHVTPSSPSGTPGRDNVLERHVTSPVASSDGVAEVDGDSSQTIDNTETSSANQGTDWIAVSKQELEKASKPAHQHVQIQNFYAADDSSRHSNEEDYNKAPSGEEAIYGRKQQLKATSSGLAETEGISAGRVFGEDAIKSSTQVIYEKDRHQSPGDLGPDSPEDLRGEEEKNHEKFGYSQTDREHDSSAINVSPESMDGALDEEHERGSGFEQHEHDETTLEAVRHENEDKLRVEKPTYKPKVTDLPYQKGNDKSDPRMENERNKSDKDGPYYKTKFIPTDAQDMDKSDKDEARVPNRQPQEEEPSTSSSAKFFDTDARETKSDDEKSHRNESKENEGAQIVNPQGKPAATSEDKYSLDDLIKVEIQPTDAPVRSQIEVSARQSHIKANQSIENVLQSENHVDMSDYAETEQPTLEGSSNGELITVELQSDDAPSDASTEARDTESWSRRPMSLDLTKLQSGSSK